MLEFLKNSKKTVGVKQSAKAISAGQVKTVVIARDADDKVVSSIKDLCKDLSVEIIYADTLKQLGKACGIEVGAAVVCVLK